MKTPLQKGFFIAETAGYAEHYSIRSYAVGLFLPRIAQIYTNEKK